MKLNLARIPLLVVSSALLAAGLGLAWIAHTNSDLPPLGLPIMGDARVFALERLAIDVAVWSALIAFLAPVLEFGALLALIFGGLAFAALSPLGPRPVGAWTAHPTGMAALLAWPFAGGFWAFAVWAPALLAAIDRPQRQGRMRPVTLSAVVVAADLFTALLPSIGATTELLFAGLLANAACLKGRRLAVSALWLIMVGIAFIDPAPERVVVNAGPNLESRQTAQMRRAAAAGLAPFDTPGARNRLPPSIRPPLRIEGEGRAFLPGGSPDLPGRDDLPRWGTWSASGAPRTGEFVSGPLHSALSLLQIRVAGSLHPPETELYLQTDDGRRILPLERTIEAPSRWHRLNFDVPSGGFRLVARSTGSARYLAFTAPEEFSRASWLAGKLARTWPAWLAAGLALAAAAALPGLAFESPLRVKSGRVRLWPVAPALLLLAYAAFFARHLDTTAGPNDAGGYLNSAKLLAANRATAAPREPFPASDIAPYVPATFDATSDGRLAPTYAPGFPLLVAAVAHVVPLAAAVPTVMLVDLALGVVFTFLLARSVGLPRGSSLFVASVIALCPVYLFQGLQPQSDGPALAWVTAAVYFAWTSRDRPRRAWLAGLATGFAVLIRPSNLLCVLPLAVCFTGRWRQMLRWVAGGLPAAVFQLWYNHRLYGHALSTGYGNASDVSTGFGWRFVAPTLRAYGGWLPLFLTPIIVLAVAGPWSRRLTGHARAMLVVWTAAFFVFYTFYWCTYDNWYNMRFILPAAPALVILGVAGALALGAPWGAPRVLRIAVPLLLLAAPVAEDDQQRILYWMRANRVAADGAIWARDHFPSDAVVFAKNTTGALMYYTDLTFVRSDVPTASSEAYFDALRRAHRPVYALTYHWEQKDFHWGSGKGGGYPNLPGTWDRLASIDDGEIYAWKRR